MKAREHLRRRKLGRKVIYGCESRGDAHLPYLTRYTLLSCRAFQVCVHVFHRSDHQDMHDHPWSFASLILWRGYVEESPCAQCKGIGFVPLFDFRDRFMRCPECQASGRIRVRRRPLSLAFRKAAHVHRVELIEGRPAVTLTVMGPYCRTWGFWIGHKWTEWREYFAKMGCK